MKPEIKFDWKPRSGFMGEDKDGNTFFSPMPRLRVHITTRWGQVCLQRTLVRTKKKAAEKAAAAGMPVPDRYYSWSLGRVVVDPILMEDGTTVPATKWVADERLSTNDAIDTIVRIGQTNRQQLIERLNSFV